MPHLEVIRELIAEILDVEISDFSFSESIANYLPLEQIIVVATTLSQTKIYYA